VVAVGNAADDAGMLREASPDIAALGCEGLAAPVLGPATCRRVGARGTRPPGPSRPAARRAVAV